MSVWADIAIAGVAVAGGVVGSVVTWFLGRRKHQAEAANESAGAVHETVDAISAVLAVYKAENIELRDSIEELRLLNARLEAEVETLKKLCKEAREGMRHE